MRKLLFCAAGAALLASVPMAAQAATITVAPSLAPNIYGSPNWNTYRDNAHTALRTGVSSFGTPDTPGYYQTVTTFTTLQNLVTSHTSWEGMADPGNVFGPQYANERGTRLHWGASFDCRDQQCSASQISHESHSGDDPYNALSLSYAAGSFNYSDRLVGILLGGDGILNTGDDQYVTSGPNTTLVDFITYVGVGNAFWPTCNGCTVEQQQAAHQEAADYPGFDFTWTGGYAMGGDTGGASVLVTTGAIPEPATWAMMIMGFGGIGAVLRRRQSLALAI